MYSDYIYMQGELIIKTNSLHKYFTLDERIVSYSPPQLNAVHETAASCCSSTALEGT